MVGDGVLRGWICDGPFEVFAAPLSAGGLDRLHLPRGAAGPRPPTQGKSHTQGHQGPKRPPHI